MSDYQAEVPEMDRINNQRVDWTAVTKEGNKFCQSLNKKLKSNPDGEQFKTDYIFQMNQLLDTVYDAINNKVPGLGDYLEQKDMEQLQRPDWSRAMLDNDELRVPIRGPNHFAEQITDIESKLQNILAKIPSTDDFITEMKAEFQKGNLGASNEFIRVQKGLTHVTLRMDEIEDFSTLWKAHKDALTNLLKKKNHPFNARPVDIANIRFYQFIHHPIGQSCFMMITLKGWPTTEEWKSWEAWWNIQVQRVTDYENHLGIKSVTSTWPMQVAHTSSMIMQAVQEINIAAATNIAALQLEPLIWKIAFIKNALTEIFVIPKENETGWFKNLFEINEKLTKQIPTVKDMQKWLSKLVPARIADDHILHVSTPVKDLLAIRDFKYTVATSNVPVPRIRSLTENYRLNLAESKSQQDPEPEKSNKSKSKPTKIASVKDKKKKPVKKRKRKQSSSESSDQETEKSSSDGELTQPKILIGSSSSEDEDFI